MNFVMQCLVPLGDVNQLTINAGYAVEVLLMSNPSVMTMKREKLRSKHIVMSGAMNERD